jgi:hypothetical protein
VLHFDGMDHTPLRENAESNIPVELQFIGSHTLSVNLILQASEAYELGYDVLMYNATRHDVHYAKNPDLLWTCRTRMLVPRRALQRVRRVAKDR